MMKSVKYTAVLAALAIVVTLTGCGGGGGGSNVSLAPKTSLKMNVELPRVANTTLNYALVEIMEYGTSGYTTLGSDYGYFTCDSSTETCDGIFWIEGLPAGVNYICKISAQYTYYDTSYARSAGQTTLYYTFIGSIVDSLSVGSTSLVAVNTTTTAQAIATIYYAYTNSIGLASVTSTEKSAINTALAAELADTTSTLALGDFVTVNAGTDMFLMSNWSSTFTDKLDTVLIDAGLEQAATDTTPVETDTTPPQVSSFSPAANATGVTYDSTSFSVVFSESMDSSVNLNTSSILSASGFSISITSGDTGNSLTIDSSNALSYGTFSWTMTTESNDTLVYTLNSSYSLAAAGLSVLKPGVTYSITSRTVPTNLTDVAGNPLDTSTNIPTTGSFTTASGPQVSAFSPVRGATTVAYDQPVFKVIFTTTMDTTISPVNTISSFSITLEKADTGGTLIIDSSNAGSYGSFSWSTTTITNDTLEFQLKSNSELETNGLKYLLPETTYYITDRTVPTHLKDASGFPLDPETNVPADGWFTTDTAYGMITY